MKIIHSVNFLNMLRNRMGTYLIYNLYIDTDGEFYVTVSDHKSLTRKFKDNVKMHRVHISKDDMNKQNFTLCDEINTIFKELFTENTDEPIS